MPQVPPDQSNNLGKLPLQKHRQIRHFVSSNGIPFLHHHFPAFDFQIGCKGMPKFVILNELKMQKNWVWFSDQKIFKFKSNIKNQHRFTFVIVILMQLRQFSIVVLRESTLWCNVYNENNKATVFIQTDLIAIRISYGEIVNRCGRFVINIVTACHLFGCFAGLFRLWKWKKKNRKLKINLLIEIHCGV